MVREGEGCAEGEEVTDLNSSSNLDIGLIHEENFVLMLNGRVENIHFKMYDSGRWLAFNHVSYSSNRTRMIGGTSSYDDSLKTYLSLVDVITHGFQDVKQ